MRDALCITSVIMDTTELQQAPRWNARPKLKPASCSSDTRRAASRPHATRRSDLRPDSSTAPTGSRGERALDRCRGGAEPCEREHVQTREFSLPERRVATKGLEMDTSTKKCLKSPSWLRLLDLLVTPAVTFMLRLNAWSQFHIGVSLCGPVESH